MTSVLLSHRFETFQPRPRSHWGCLSNNHQFLVLRDAILGLMLVKELA